MLEIINNFDEKIDAQDKTNFIPEYAIQRKIAVVLFNLGGPDSLQAVKPFLFNLFNDKNIITLPKFFRYFIAKLIASRREKTAQKIYSHTGNKSPILEQTLAQKKALKDVLNNQGKDKNYLPKNGLEFEIFICMRHWHPRADEVVREIENYASDEVILLPLYPQFSTTTTGSSLEEFKGKIKKIKCKTLCCYSADEHFINAHLSLIEDTLSHIHDLSNFKMLFSAHGLPERIVKSGDPYQWQIEQTVEKIIEKLSLNSKYKDLNYKISYQSRVGPLKWLEPNTENEIKLAGLEKKSLIIVPIAFVSEHVETLVELDIEYKKIANTYNIEYIRIPTLSTNDMFIKSLAIMVMKLVNQSSKIVTSSEFMRVCPAKFSKCYCV